MENEQRFNQGMHFVSTEMVNITASSGAGDMEHCFGYPRAIRTIHGWVKDNVSRKRVFATEKGWVGIGWQALRKGDLVIKVPGLKSRLTLRKIEDAGSGETYRVLGPCLIPAVSEEVPWGRNRGNRKRFEIT